MTITERLKNKNLTPLAIEFVQWLNRVAVANGKSINDIWHLWEKYTYDCTCHDQSPVEFEFLQWNKLTGEVKNESKNRV